MERYWISIISENPISSMALRVFSDTTSLREENSLSLPPTAAVPPVDTTPEVVAPDKLTGSSFFASINSVAVSKWFIDNNPLVPHSQKFSQEKQSIFAKPSYLCYRNIS